MARKKVKKTKQYKIVKVGRFDSELKEYAFDNGDTVSSVLNKAGITLSEGEEVNSIKGNSLDINSKVKSGDSLIIVSNYKSG